jgi:hypothetical protein
VLYYRRTERDMADVEDSFNSTGATVVAFETINSEGFPSFGVSVTATTCGVYGRTMSMAGDPGHDQRSAPSSTGVLGRGDGHGVYGVTSLVSDEDTPDFTQKASTVKGIGVVGVNAGDSPAMLGTNGLVGVDFTNSTALTDVVNEDMGVAGVSVSGPGVLGLSLDGNPLANPDVTDVLEIGDVGDGTTVAGAGVLGVSTTGPGVRGFSQSSRGGIFQSGAGDELLPQVRLIPNGRFDAPPGSDVVPPPTGASGDLLAMTYVDGNQRTRAALFFCIGGNSDLGAAVWVRLA